MAERLARDLHDRTLGNRRVGSYPAFTPHEQFVNADQEGTAQLGGRLLPWHDDARLDEQ